MVGGIHITSHNAPHKFIFAEGGKHKNQAKNLSHGMSEREKNIKKRVNVSTGSYAN